jgi:hypothetical protein
MYDSWQCDAQEKTAQRDAIERFLIAAGTCSIKRKCHFAYFLLPSPSSWASAVWLFMDNSPALA